MLIIKLSTEIPLYKDQGGKILVQVMFVEQKYQKRSLEKPEISAQHEHRHPAQKRHINNSGPR